jgi:DnaJ like chaperone protein
MGWLLGAGFGFMLGGPLGAVVGGALQHVLSRRTQRSSTGHVTAPEQEQVFITYLVAILTKICVADGSISEAERKTMHNFFSRGLHYKGMELRFIDAIIGETQRTDPDLYQICKAFDQLANKQQRLLLLDLIYQVVMTDHVVTKSEGEAIQQVVSALGIGTDEHEHIKLRYAPAKKSDHYHTLGLKPTVDNSEIKRAYRQLASQYHPDKVTHLGPELIAFSEKKFKSINHAYTSIRKERNF